MTIPRPRRRTVAALLTLPLLATACSSGRSDPAAPAEGSNASDGGGGSDGGGAAEASGTWPRTVEIGTGTVTLEQPPAAIVAITSEAADLVLQLAGPERMVAVPASSTSPHSGTAVELAEQVAQTLPPGIEPDPEQILALGPDLVISTARHGGEEEAGDQLEQTGVPTVNLSPDAFSTPEAISATVRSLGELLGEETLATEIADRFDAEIAEQDARAIADGPTAIALMARGGNVMVMQGTMLAELITRAGGVDVAAEHGIDTTRPLDAELLGVLAPEVIFVEDFQGTGTEPFDELLGSAALAEVPAIAEDEVHLVPMTEASGVSGLSTPIGYAAVLDSLEQAAR
jgi:iron complex transport system substrate-binding protein